MLFDDLRHGWRRLRAHPDVTLAAAGMLALGIGLTTAMFTVVDALILRPVPFRNADRLLNIPMMTEHGGRSTVSAAVLEAWRLSPAFASAEGASAGSSVIETATGPIVRASARVSPGLFAMLGTDASRGRTFDRSEGRAGTDDRVVLSEDVWRSVFGADPNMIGRRITLDGTSVVVVGLMPASFRFPAWNTVVWRPLDFSAPPPALTTLLPVPYLRVAPGVPLPDALRMATDAAHSADPSTAQTRATPRPLAGMAMDSYSQRAVPMLAGAVGLVFLVLCANVCSLLLARLSARQREFRMCAALGASRARLLRQAAIEHALLGAVGSGLGVAVAWGFVSVSRVLLPAAFLLHTLSPIGLDVRACLVATLAGAVAIAGAGVLPAWIGTRPDGSSSLGRTERTSTETIAARTLTRVLLVTEVALACTLLAGATLLVRSFINLASVDRGLRTDGVLTTWIALPSKAYPDRAARVAVTDALEDAVRHLPGVDKVVLTSGLPPDGGATHFYSDWRSDDPRAHPIALQVESYDVGPDYFEFYGIPLLGGRGFKPGDGEDDVVVSARLADSLWPTGDPVGRSFRFGQQHKHVIGVAREINYPSLDLSRDVPEFYQPFTPGSGYIFMNIRCQGGCPNEAVIRKQVLATVPRANIIKLALLNEAYGEEIDRPRAAAALGSTFAVIAVLAVAGGLFSVLSYAVGRRRREFGIRTSLGASPAQIRRLVFREGFRMAALGVAAGMAGSLVLVRTIASLEYGMTGFDPITWIFVVGLLGVTTVGASLRPARSAVRVDPVVLLREE
jgi:putative ABC transport system permease protein